MTKKGLFRISGVIIMLLFLTGSNAFGADPPHSTSGFGSVECGDCHVGHTSLGNMLTSDVLNSTLCQKCHNASGSASDLPINDIDKAVPGLRGTSHSFEVPAVNAGLETQAPLDTQMNLRIMNNNIVCSTCHDQHAATDVFGGDSRVGKTKKLTALGTGTMVSGGTFMGSVGFWYFIEIDSQGSQSTATFQWSKDNGTSWMGQNVNCGNGSPVPLDNGVTVTFSGGNNTLQVGEQWLFSASWPFLRATQDSGDNASGSKYCRDCHRTWEMEDGDVEAWDGTYKSHPVGIPLDNNARGYDRIIPLDANGADQGSGGADSNDTNDLRLDFDVANNVHCLSCHSVHDADSSSSTVDGQ